MKGKIGSHDQNNNIIEVLQLLLQEFHDLIPQELPSTLPPTRNVQHHIDLIPSARLPNLPHYCMSPTEHAELQRQFDEVL